MATMTQDEIDFLKSQGLPVPEIPTVETSTPTTSDALIPDEILYGGTEEDWEAYTNSIVEQNTPSNTAPVTQETRDAFTYDNLYGTYQDPTTGETKDRPDLDIYDRIGSTWYDIFNPSDADPMPSQVARDQYYEDKKNWAEATRNLYEGQSFYNEDGRKIYDRYVPVKDAEGNVIDYRYEKVLIPDPLLDQSAFNRVIEQAGRTIYQEVGGLVTEGSVLGGSEFERSRADLDQAGGEALATSILTIAAPTFPVAKAAKYGGKLIKYGKEGAKTGQLGATGVLATEGAAVALSEAILAAEGDEGLLVKGSKIQEVFPNIPDAQADNLAMFVDGLLVNGTMDGALSLIGLGLGKAWGKVSAGKQLANKEALKAAVKDGTVLEVVKYLDPEIADLNAVDAKLRISALANVLNNNQTIELALGGATKKIDNDTTNALMMGAEAYIRETRAGLKSTMTPEAFEQMVQDKAAEMSSAMIGLFRSQQANPAVQASADRVPSQIGEFIGEVADNITEDSLDATAQSAASSLVRQADNEVAGLTAQADDVARQTDELLSAQSTVVENNPIVQDLIANNTGGYGLFNTNSREVRQALTDIVVDEGYALFKSRMDEVDAAYKALPPAEIDAELLRSKLMEVTRAANDIDGSGGRAAAVLRDIFEGFEPKTVGRQTDPMPVVGEATSEAIMETPEQVIERITKEVSFKDLYDLKGRLAAVIDSYSNDRTIQRRLIEFRNHITDSEAGQLAHVIDTAPSDVASAYGAADQLYKTAMADFANSEPLRRLTDKMAEVRKFDTERGAIPGDAKRNEPDMILGANTFVDETIGDGTGVLMDQLTNMLKDVRPNTQLNGAFRDLFRAQAANALRDAVASGAAKGSNNPQEILFQAFQPVREQLQALGDTALLDDMERAFQQIETAYGSLGDIKLANDELLKNLEADMIAAQESVVGMLIDTPRGSTALGVSGPTRSTPTSSAKEVIRNIMKSNNSENRINELMAKIATLPEEAERKLATEALQAVAMRELANGIFGATGTAMKSGTEARRTVALGTVSKLSEDEASNLFKSLNAVYGKDEQMSGAVIDLVNMMYQTSLPSRLKVSPSGSDTIINAARDSNIRDAVSTAILLTAGYMNPTAAMLRRITAVPVAEAEQLQKDIAAHVLATVVYDPKQFSSMLKDLAEGNTASATEKAKATAAALGGMSVLGTRFEVRVQEEDAFGEEDSGTIDRDMKQLLGLEPAQ